jgi:hypothetical protein
MSKLNTFRKLRAIENEPQKPSFQYAVESNSKFVWTTGADVMKTWKRHGFVPPTEYRDDYFFKKNREGKENNE